MNLGTEASVSVSAGNKLMDTQVAIPDPADPAGDQVVTYSITDIPPDTYEVAVTLTSNIGWKGVKYSYGFTVITVNGKQQSAASDSVGTVPQTRTFSLNERLPITGATTINFDLHPVVSPGKN
jgi:hypothetical protein